MTARNPDARTAKILKILCFTMIGGILGATLWPFNPIPRNQVSWLQGTNGISFGVAGLVLSKTLLVPADVAADSGPCSLELLLRPASTDSSYVILGFYSRTSPRKFLVRQWTDGLLVTHDEDAQHRAVKEKFDVDHAFGPGVLRLVTIVSEPSGSTVYLDGKKAHTFSKFKIPRSDLSGEIVLGSSAVDYQPWQGEISGLAIYARALTSTEVSQHFADWTRSNSASPNGTEPAIQSADLQGALARYDFSERSGRLIHNQVASGPDLEIPEHFSVPHKAMLRSPLKEFNADWWYLYDVAVNIAGFAPLGFLVCTYLETSRTRQSAVLWTILTGAALSFTVEFLQFYIPRRESGITDIITNTLGAGLGAMIAGTGLFRDVLEWIV